MNKTKDENFAQLLTEAIYSIKRREGKKISIIQDELMYKLKREGGNPVEYWRKGNVPVDQSEFIMLSQELVKRGQLSKEWLASFWAQTKFVGLKEVMIQLFPNMDNYLRFKSFSQLIGREKQIAEISNTFSSKDTNRIIAIDGMGGIGKTALAFEVADRGLRNKVFDAVYWITDEDQDEGRNKTSKISFDMILNKLGIKLGQRNITSLSLAQKINRVRTSLSTERYLIIIDNLERAIDQQEKIIQGIHEILGRNSKALIMSRKRFSKGVYHVHLQGLLSAHAINFLRQEAKSRGIRRLENASDKFFNIISEKSGGSPLALKLVVGQLNYESVDLVLERLQNVQLYGEDSFDEYAKLYQNIFMPSWELLSFDGKKMLISISHFSSGFGGTFEAIKVTSALSTNQAARKIDELWKLAFLEIGDSTLSQTRYYLHALTQYFVLSDIVKTL